MDRRAERIEALEAEIAALWAFVRADDRAEALYPAVSYHDTGGPLWEALNEASDARIALEAYERP